MLKPEDVTLKLIHKTTGAETITTHRVWDRQRFIESQLDQYDGPETKDEDRHYVHHIFPRVTK